MHVHYSHVTRVLGIQIVRYLLMLKSEVLPLLWTISSLSEAADFGSGYATGDEDSA